MLNFDSIVIGSGIAGMTASIYLKRANLNVLLIESTIPGGQINRSSLVENYPGYKEIDGPTLSMNVFEQVSNLNVKYENESVLSVKKEDKLFRVKTSKNEYLTKTVIVASGRRPRELGLPNEHDLIGRGISWCAYCDGFFQKGKDVVIVGGGNSALEEALYLSNIANKIYIVLRSDKFRADNYLQDKVFKKSNIEIIYNANIKELITESDLLNGVLLDNGKTLKVTGVFEYIGSIPNTDFLKETNVNLNHDYIVVNNKMETNVEGMFACGDVINKDIYQLSTAVGEGTVAANSASRYLD